TLTSVSQEYLMEFALSVSRSILGSRQRVRQLGGIGETRGLS
ncbi:unnamed protein product, partial [marine sediment metagenome]